MKITHDVREYVSKVGVYDGVMLAADMSEKAKEFTALGGEIYQGNLPEGAKGHH